MWRLHRSIWHSNVVNFFLIHKLFKLGPEEITAEPRYSVHIWILEYWYQWVLTNFCPLVQSQRPEEPIELSTVWIWRVRSGPLSFIFSGYKAKYCCPILIISKNICRLPSMKRVTSDTTFSFLANFREITIHREFKFVDRGKPEGSDVKLLS